MLWAPCLRIDLPADTPRGQVSRVAEALGRFLDVMEEALSLNATCAFSAAALLCFERHGQRALLDRAGALALERRLELVATAAHGALLPLLPPREIERQLLLNDEANRRWFGDTYRPETIWSPFLATAPLLAEVASELGFTSMLVDEAATRCWPGMWPGDRVDALAAIPGFFALPCSRAGGEAFDRAHLNDWDDLQAFVPPQDRLARSYLITAVDLTAESRTPEALLLLRNTRTLRLADLFSDLPLDQTIDLMPCSSLSTPEELGQELPFATWFRPGDSGQTAKWGVLRKLVDLMDQIHEAGLGATPEATVLREALDISWRESWWRTPGDIDTSTRLHDAVDRVSRILRPREKEELLAAIGT